MILNCTDDSKRKQNHPQLQKECNDTSLPHVVGPIHNSTPVSLQPGQLEETCFTKQPRKGKKSIYRYYIFMDDDIQLKTADKSTQNLYRMYEESLKIFQPAAVFALFSVDKE